MLPYSDIASLLDDISRADKAEKLGLLAGFLTHLTPDQTCPIVRLFAGKLWPSWSLHEMGMGPESVAGALQDVSLENIEMLRTNLKEIGALAEAALWKKSQHLILNEPLDAMRVYNGLRRISKQSGPDSDRRKRAILRGLFLEATPKEAKYIARTVMKSMLVGLGTQTILGAISKAFRTDLGKVKHSYHLLPEPGMVAEAACKGDLPLVRIMPSRPLKPMTFRLGELLDSKAPRAYLVRYPGLRVQVHKTSTDFYIFTMRLKDITSSLESLFNILSIGHEFIAEADLACFQNGRMLSQPEVVGFINRRHLSIRSAIKPSLIVSDLLYLDGEDLTGTTYAERRQHLEALLRGAEKTSEPGITIAEERVIQSKEEAEQFCRSVVCSMKRLISRDLDASYLAGQFSRDDWLIKDPKEIHES